MAVCNTLAVSEFHKAFREDGVEVLSWIHELPTFISLLGGELAALEIKLASRKIMVPSEAVRTALSSRFLIDAESIQTVYNGQDPRTQGLDRDAQRLLVRRELGLPHNATIVLGCGTVDLRKGADLFVNVVRRVLFEQKKNALAPLTWFVWVGEFIDSNLRRWLLHDARAGGLRRPHSLHRAARFDGSLLPGCRSVRTPITRRPLPAREYGGDGERHGGRGLRGRRRCP